MTDSSRGEKPGKASLGDLLAEVSNDISTLFRQEVALAKAELQESAKRAGRGAGMLGGAGVAGYLALLFLSFALWWGLAHVIDIAWSAFIVAVIWGAIAAVLALRGKKEIKSVKGAPQTAETIKEIPETFK